MTIHPSIRAKADKLGLIGEDNPAQIKLVVNPPEGTVQFHWPAKNVYAFGVGAKAAMAEMEAIMKIAQIDPDWRIFNVPRDPFMIELFNKDRSLVFIRGGATPRDTLGELNGDDGDRVWLSTTVPDDGAEAYRQGFTAADNPFPDPNESEESDTDEMETPWGQWNLAWDEAADAAEQETDDEETSGSVVKPIYRIRYAEMGHPNHCGDWLAVTLNNLILGKSLTDIANLDALAEANNVSLAKYKREGNGWQGRLRMTARNLLARVIYTTGFLNIPPSLRDMTGGAEALRVPREWIETRSYKGKSALENEAYMTPVPAEPEPAPAPPAELTDDQRKEMLKRHRASKGKK
jgi:hypothetical protein